MLFGLFILWREGTQPALEYYTGYLIELSLSVDNLFVFILIFSYFGVPAEAQPKVLKWGILGAIVMRVIMIALGALLLERFDWIIYVFGGILILTGIRMLDPEGRDRSSRRRTRSCGWPGGSCRSPSPTTGPLLHPHTAAGGCSRTPLLLVLLVVEWSDLVFAIDSIPAIFAVTRDPFLVYSSNVFAILGLRALFFVLAGMMDKFVYLKPGVALILVFVGRQDDAELLGPHPDPPLARRHPGDPRDGGRAVAPAQCAGGAPAGVGRRDGAAAGVIRAQRGISPTGSTPA